MNGMVTYQAEDGIIGTMTFIRASTRAIFRVFKSRILFRDILKTRAGRHRRRLRGGGRTRQYDQSREAAHHSAESTAMNGSVI
jgi:hypothetical protein